MTRRSVGSIFWGLALIVGGGIFLAKNLGYPIEIWNGIARYWPVLLIVWGGIKLIDYYRWQRSGQQGSLFSGGEVVLLVLVILVGSSITAAANINSDIGEWFELADIDLWDITGNSYEYTEHQEMEVRAGSTVNIINRYGTVDVTPADTDRIVLDVRKTVIASTQEEADRLAPTFTYSIASDASGYRVWSTLNRDTNRVRGRRFKTSLTVRVPKSSHVVVDNRNGDVTLSDLVGDQRVSNGYGRVAVRGITGSATVSNRNETVLVENIEGTAKVDNEYSDINVKNVSGRLELRHRHGRVEIADVRGGAAVTNSFGPIYVSKVRGPVEINGKNSSIDVMEAADALNARTEFEHVSMVDVLGEIDLRVQHGRAHVAFTQPPRRNIRINSQYGDVTLEVPRNSAFSIDARTRYGNASSDFKELSVRSDQERNSISGQLGSAGPEIRIDNRNGSIHLEER
jgi:DUF4097 and DUF4098 domain-containing protein YvlB